MAESENVVVATAERIFADFADPQTIIQSRRDAWKAPLWSALEEVGLTLTWVPEDRGGGGATLEDGFEVIRAAGRAALAAPLAETMLAGWLLDRAGLSSPRGAMSVAATDARSKLVCDAEGRISGRVRRMPFAREAHHLAVIASGPTGNVVALVRASDCIVKHHENLAGDPRDSVEFANVVPVASAIAGETDIEALLLMGATVRSLQIAGALEKILQIAVGYSMERVAFEKLISKFQAVQHNLARLGGEVAAALSASVSAAEAMTIESADSPAAILEVASAKIRAGEAAEAGSAIAHQVLGAIGFTEEHILHRYTLRTLAWRDDFGDESHWGRKLGALVVSRGADSLWPLIASR